MTKPADNAATADWYGRLAAVEYLVRMALIGVGAQELDHAAFDNFLNDVQEGGENLQIVGDPDLAYAATVHCQANVGLIIEKVREEVARAREHNAKSGA